MARPGASVFFVTGKGGAGKSTLARTLALGAMHGGLRTLLVRTHPGPSAEDAEAGGDGAAAGSDDAAAASAPRGGEERAGAPPEPNTVDLDPRSSLRGFLTRTLRFRFLSERLMDSRTFSAVATAAPGLGDLVTLAAVAELARERAGGPELIVVDAPASGQFLPLLSSPARILDLVRVGPVATIARDCLDMITDIERCRVVIATLAEELCIAETGELARGLRRLGVELAPAVVNGVFPAIADEEQTAWLERHPHSGKACWYLRTRRRQLELIDKLERQTGPTLSLPFVFREDDPPALDATRLVTDILEGTA